jgi:hypothetical protein
MDMTANRGLVGWPDGDSVLCGAGWAIIVGTCGFIDALYAK